MKLSVGANTGCRILALAAAIPFGIVTMLLMVLAVSAVVPSALMDGIDFWSGLGLIVILAVLGLALYLTGGMTWALLRILRSSVWLKGQHLVERLIVRRVRVDLLAADVELRVAEVKGVSETSLLATDRNTGAHIDLLLRKGAAALPSAQLNAVADAIGTNPVVAAQLREMAIR